MDTEYVYYNECHHLYCDNIKSQECLKRYIDVINYNNRNYTVIICNEYIRLTIKQKIKEFEEKLDYNNLDYYLKYRSSLYEMIIEEIIEEVVPDIDITCIRNYNSNINPIVNYRICSRPSIIRRIDLFTAVELSIDLGLMHISNSFYGAILNSIYNVIKYLSKYEKYSKYEKEIEHITKKLKPWNCDTKNDQRITELFIIFFEIQTNLKISKNYGTS